MFFLFVCLKINLLLSKKMCFLLFFFHAFSYSIYFINLFKIYMWTWTVSCLLDELKGIQLCFWLNHVVVSCSYRWHLTIITITETLWLKFLYMKWNELSIFAFVFQGWYCAHRSGCNGSEPYPQHEWSWFYSEFRVSYFYFYRCITKNPLKSLSMNILRRVEKFYLKSLAVLIHTMIRFYIYLAIFSSYNWTPYISIALVL